MATSTLSLFDAPRRLLPGLALAVAVAVAAYYVRKIPGLAVFSPMILAILIGMAVANLAPLPAACSGGLAFAMRPVLRAAIVLLGLRITLGDLAALGWQSLACLAVGLVATFVVTARIGRAMGLARETAELVAAGTAVCGASAIVAMNAVTGGRREDVAHAVATVTLFGTLSMFLLPALAPLLHLSPASFGLWAGASIHEVAQVVGAGFQGGPEAGEVATVAKLARVAMLAPLVFAVGFLRGRGVEATSRPPFPWFVAGFLAMVVVGSVLHPDRAMLAAAGDLTTVLFTVALAAMGLMVDVRALLRDGWKPMALGAVSWLFVTGFALLWVEVLARSAP